MATYDVENRLVTAAVVGTTTTLAYDPLGRLNQTTVGSTVTQFLYDGEDLVGEYTSGGSLLRRYVHGPGVDEPLVWYEGSGTTDRRWLMADRQGSIVGQADGTGAVTQLYAYGPYGEPQDGWATGSRFRYTGQIALSEARLYHDKARVYDPGTGRFLQTDPVGYGPDLDWYVYVGEDPLGRNDPRGTQAQAACAVLIEVPPAAAACAGIVTVVVVTVGVTAASSGLKGDTPDKRDIPASDRKVGRNDNGGPGGPKPPLPIPPVGTKLNKDRISAPPSARGRAPKGDDGHPVELHHRGQAQGGPIDEMTRTDHRGPGNFGQNHDNTGQDPSQIDRSQWRRQQREYWKREQDSGRFDDDDQ